MVLFGRKVLPTVWTLRVRRPGERGRYGTELETSGNRDRTGLREGQDRPSEGDRTGLREGQDRPRERDRTGLERGTGQA